MGSDLSFTLSRMKRHISGMGYERGRNRNQGDLGDPKSTICHEHIRTAVACGTNGFHLDSFSGIITKNAYTEDSHGSHYRRLFR